MPHEFPVAVVLLRLILILPTSKSVTRLITLERGGGKIDHGYYELYFTKESNMKERHIGPTKGKLFVFLSIFYLPLFNSITKELFLG
jgi:hypothetical protein